MHALEAAENRGLAQLKVRPVARNEHAIEFFHELNRLKIKPLPMTLDTRGVVSAPGDIFRAVEAWSRALLIDEADSFLTDRSRARQQWEASMVNEMLRQMDAGRVRFIATPNRAELLDAWEARMRERFGHVQDRTAGNAARVESFQPVRNGAA